MSNDQGDYELIVAIAFFLETVLAETVSNGVILFGSFDITRFLVNNYLLQILLSNELLRYLCFG
jgi:hypothetical protein